MKRNYLISIIAMGLIVLSLYSTFAMFTETVETNDIVTMSASTLSIDSKIVEYERLEINSQDKKVIEFTVNNDTNNALYYGIWYEMVNPSVKNDDIIIGKKEDTLNDTKEQLMQGENAKVTFVIENKTSSTITINIGVGYSSDNNLNLPTNRYLIMEVYQEKIMAFEYIESLLASNLETMNNDDPDGNVRYMGSNPNNYVWFNNELWRIIGVFDVASTYGGPTEKRIKIIRSEPIRYTPWDNKPSGTGSSISINGSNDWTDSALMEVLNNGAYYNRTNGTCPYGSNGITTSCDFSTNGLTEETKFLIADTYWNLGGINSLTSSLLTSLFYEYERGNDVYSGHLSYWIGKVGLMYPSDYGYATSGGPTTNRKSCLENGLNTWDALSECRNNDYLHNSSWNQWTITPSSNYSNSVFIVKSNGFFSSNSTDTSSYASPVVYLKSTVQITGGTGTSTDPYTLSV